MTDTFMRVKVPTVHDSFIWADAQANPSVAYPATYKYADPWRINKAWLDFVYRVNALMGTLAGFHEGMQVWSGYVNSAPNLAYKPGSYVQYPNPDPYPRIEQVITVLNPIKVKERLANAVVFDVFNYYAQPPDVNKINPKTQRWMFDEFHSIDRDGNVGLAPKGLRFWIPRVAMNGYARLPLEILEPYEFPAQEEQAMTLEIPTGKGLWIWQILQVQQLYGQAHLQMDGIKAYAQGTDLDHVVAKIATDRTKYNLRRYDPRYSWTAIYDDLIPALRDALHSIGVKVWGYAGVVKGSYDYPELSAQFHVQRTIDMQLDGLIADAEDTGSWNGWTAGSDRFNRAERYASAAKQAAAGRFAIGLSTYRFIKTSQPTFPTTQFMRHLDFGGPQVYWVKNHNPEYQLNKAINEWRQVTNKPIVPAGAAYTEHQASYRYADRSLWLPTETDLVEFHNACKAAGLPGYNLWEWANAGLNGLLPIIGNLRWGAAPLPEPEPVPADALERLWSAAHQAGWKDAGWLD